MKMVYSNRTFIYLAIFEIVFFSIVAIICAFLLINSILNNQTNLIIASSILLVVYICIVSLLVLGLNRFGYKIIYNADEGTIMRKGFICGYKYTVKIEEIQDIVIATINSRFREKYYVIIDPYNTKYAGGLKKSFIRIEKNENNLKFIRQFWDKPIKNN